MASMLGSAWRSLFPSLWALSTSSYLPVDQRLQDYDYMSHELSMALSMFSRTSVYQWHVTFEKTTVVNSFFVVAHRLQQ